MVKIFVVIIKLMNIFNIMIVFNLNYSNRDVKMYKIKSTTKKAGLYIMLFLLFAAGVYYFFEKESASVYGKSAGETLVNKNQGKFIPEQTTDYIFFTSSTEMGVNILNITILMISLGIIFFMIRKWMKIKRN